VASARGRLAMITITIAGFLTVFTDEHRKVRPHVNIFANNRKHSRPAGLRNASWRGSGR
jgi:hypothetical protein